jgi:membrane dipeptidase
VSYIYNEQVLHSSIAPIYFFILKIYLSERNLNHYLKMRKIFLLISVALVWSCNSTKEQDTEAALRAKADSLAHRYIIVDGHVDLPYMLKEEHVTFSEATKDTLLHTTMGEFDYERAKKGGLDAPFMSIYIPVEDQLPPDYGRSLADSLIATVNDIIRILPDQYAAALTPADVKKNFSEGKISLPMGMENGAPIGKDLSGVKYYYDKGIRYITLTHNKDNQICDASSDNSHTWNGLSPFGKQVVGEMNKLGIMVDISHVDDSTFYQVMAISKAPCIASHSSARSFSPLVKRDMTDDMIRRIKDNGGVIMVNYYPTFLDSTAKSNSVKLSQLLESKGLKESDTAAAAVIRAFNAEHPNPTNAETVANHIDHIVKLAGIDHVGLGSDYDGTGGNLPVGLEDVSTYPSLIYVLLKRGYTESDIEKICSGNLLRVWDAVIATSQKLQ